MEQLEKTLVQESSAQDNGQVFNWPEATLSLEETLRLVGQLEGAGMLKNGFQMPREWILWSAVPVVDLVDTFHRHLSKKGWQRVLKALHWHNRQTAEPCWDLAQTDDFMAAIELALTRSEDVTTSESAAIDNWVPALQRQVRTMMQSQLKPAGISAWLLSPRAVMKRLSTRARHARTETQIESAISEAALHTARMVGTDTERGVALQRVDQLRETLGNQLQVFCEESDLPAPRPFSREEAYCLHLLNAYFIALAEAEGMIARRGAALARRQINLEGELAEARMDSRLLPDLLERRRRIDPLRESMMRERIRHKLALWIGGVLSAVVGSMWSVLESISDVLVAGVARYAVVVAPALLVGLITLTAQTIVYSGSLSLGVLIEFVTRALWNGLIALGAAILVYGCWLYYVSHHQSQDE